MKTRKVKLGVVGIDTGTMLLVDPCHLQEVDLGKVFDRINGSKQGGQINFGKLDRAIAFSTGMGDGFYEVFATLQDYGGHAGERIKKVEIVLIPDGWENGKIGHSAAP